MITLAQLTGAHRRTYQKIFSEPFATDVQRIAVRSLLEMLGEVAAGTGSSLKVIRNGHVLRLKSLAANAAESEGGLIALQHFLKRSEYPRNQSNGREAHLLLVIGHHEARLFRSEINGGPPHQLLLQEEPKNFANPKAIEPGSDHSKAHTDENAFFEPIAQALHSTGEVLICGESSATQVEMDRFIAWLKRQHPDLAKRIAGSMVLEKDQAGSGVLLEKARDYYVHRMPA